MTVLDVEWRLREIRRKALGLDDESACALEMALFHLVLRAIAQGGGMGEDPRELARAALKAREIDFPRSVRWA